MVGGGYITSGCGPVVYTADFFTEDYRGNTFMCDPSNNVVHRDVLEAKGSSFVAHRGDADCEFLASTDPHFRPVHLTIGPDGGLYVVDFYREVVEDLPDIPEDLRDSVNGVSCGRGRIWRIVPEKRRRVRSRLFKKRRALSWLSISTTAMPGGGCRPSGCWVERQDKSVVPELSELALNAKLPVGRAHALWTLQGLASLKDELVEQALKDASPGVREQALRLVGPYLAANSRLRAAVLSMANDFDPARPFSIGVHARRN